MNARARIMYSSSLRKSSMPSVAMEGITKFESLVLIQSTYALLSRCGYFFHFLEKN